MSACIFVEILSRLGCANVSIKGENVELEEVKIKENVIVVGELKFTLPKKWCFDSCITGLSREDNGVSFRLKVPQNEKVPTLLHSSEVPQLPVRSYRVDQPRLQIGVSQKLWCRCGSSLGVVIPGRVLALPSSGWRSNSLDWFCCIHKLSEPPKVETGTDDILYNNYCLAVKLSKIDTSKAVVKNPEIKSQKIVSKGRFCHSQEGGCHSHSDNGDANDNVQSETVQIINCKNCDEELGVIVEKDLVHLWIHNIRTFSEIGELVPISDGVSDKSDCLKMIIRTHVSDNFSRTPKFLLRNRIGDEVLLWIIDKDLLVVDGSELDVIERSFIKLLYKRTSRGISTPDSNQIEVIEVSDALFDEALEVFDKSSENLSESFKSANGFRVAYIPYK